MHRSHTTTSAGTRHRLGFTLVAASLLFVGAIGCSTLPGDSEPVAIAPEAVPSELTEQNSTSTSLPVDVPRSNAVLWFIGADTGDERLQACTVPVADSPSVEGRVVNILRELITLNPADSDDCASTLSTRLPPELNILGAQLNGTTLDLNVSQLGAVSAGAQRLAVAQIIFTATEHPDVRRVRFLTEGQFTEVPIEEDSAEPGSAIGRGDFPQFEQSITASGLTAEEEQILTEYLEAVAEAEDVAEAEEQEPPSDPPAP